MESGSYRLEVPPPTRGWPLVNQQAVMRSRGSPAHAGMAPVTGQNFAPGVRFPRPRGDGPCTSPTIGGRAPVPPPTRGWPLFGHSVRVSHGGSPAHAGMAPERLCWCSSWTGFPRPRGDGPTARGLRSLAGPVPPPTRGWPRLGPVCSMTAPGSPAHAGMAPPITTRFWLGTRFPRPRGDGPVVNYGCWPI